MLFTRHDPDDTIHGKNHIINHNPNPIYAAIVIIFTPKYVAGGGWVGCASLILSLKGVRAL